MRFPDQIVAFCDRLAGVVIENRPAAELIRLQDSAETCFYVDPPYPQEARGDSHRYRHEMTDDQHRELAAVLRSVRGMVVLSGYPCPLYDVELFPDWERVTRKAHADGGRDRTEVLWLNPAAAKRRHQSALAFDAPDPEPSPTLRPGARLRWREPDATLEGTADPERRVVRVDRVDGRAVRPFREMWAADEWPPSGAEVIG